MVYLFKSGPEYFGAKEINKPSKICTMRTQAAHIDNIGEVDLSLQHANLVIAVIAQTDVGDFHRKIPGIRARVPGGIYIGKNRARVISIK